MHEQAVLFQPSLFCACDHHKQEDTAKIMQASGEEEEVKNDEVGELRLGGLMSCSVSDPQS